MGEKDFNFDSKMFVYDDETGEMVGEVDNISATLECDTDNSLNDKKVISRHSKDYSIEFDLKDGISGEIFTIIASRADKETHDTYKIQIPIITQRRKHKKKRINKKWLRYGYNTTYIEMDVCKLGIKTQ